MNLEEIKSAIEKDENLRKGIIAFIPEMEEGKKLLENHAKIFFDQNIGAKVSEIYNGIDNDIFEVLGVRKKAEQKTYDFLKSEILPELKKLKSKGGNDDEKQKKIEDLESKVKDLTEKTTNSEFWHNTHKEALKKWEDEKQKYETKLKDVNEKTIQSLVNADLSTGLAGLKFNPTIPKVAIDTMINAVKSEVLANAKIDENGKVIYHKMDGTPWLGKDYSHITSEGIFAEKLKDVIESKQGGGGAPQTGTKGIVISGEGDNATKKIVLDKEKFNTRLGFLSETEKVLLENGIEKNSAEWQTLSDEAYKVYEVEKLPRS